MSLTARMRAIAEAAGLAIKWVERKTGHRRPPMLVVVPDALPGGAPTAIGTVQGEEAIALLRQTADQLEKLERTRQAIQNLSDGRTLH